MKYFAAILLLLYLSHNAAAQNDCADAITVCGSMNYNGLHAIGFGTQEINSATACHSQENNSIWFKLRIKDSGTLGFILEPESDDIFVDYDFWIFGPNTTCGNLGAPIRCSTTNPFTSGGTNNLTGMNATETDEHEGPNHLGNQFIRQLDVVAGQEYYLIVDRPHGDANFSIQWTGTASFFEAPYFDNPLNISLDMGVCDTDGQTDGHFLYDLTIHRSMLTGTQTGVQLTYHLDNGDATTGDNPIANPQAYTTIADPQEIYMRMTNMTTGCYTIESFTVDTVRPDFENPQNIDLNLHACDDDGTEDGFHVFNLAQHQALFLGNRPHVSVKYYETEANAYAEANAITATSPYINTANPQTFYIRLDDAITGCYNVQPFTMNVHPVPVFQNPNNISLDLQICDHDGTPDGITNFDLTDHWVMLTGGDFNLFIKYYETLNGALNNTGQIMNSFWYQNTAAQQTIYMRLENTATGCFSILSFNVDVMLPPAYNNPQNIDINLKACDNGSFEGKTTFNLTTHAPMLTGGQPNLTIKYYLQQWQADAGFSPISNPQAFTNTVNPQTIYMRLEDAVTGCHSILPFTITAIPAPVFNNPQNIALHLTECDDDGSQDGIHVFDLTLHAAMLKGAQANTLITYHTTAALAEAGTGAIANPAAYENTASPQNIYMRLANTVTGCYNTRQFSITVKPLPLFNNPQNINLDLTVCDPENDNTAVFDLTLHRPLLSAGTATRTITYHLSATDADGGNNAIASPTAYTNTAMPQTIFMRLTDAATGCHATGSFIISTVTPPLFHNPQNISLDLAACDDAAADGFAVFDLTQHRAMLINARPGHAITYYTNPTDANAGTNSITSPAAYANTSNAQTIFMRLDGGTAGCYGIASFTITVNPLPVFINPQNISLSLSGCDADSVDDQSYIFNLTPHAPMLLGSQQNIAITYHTTQADADGGNSPVTNPAAYRNTVNPQTVYMRFTNTVTGCHAIQPFTVTIVELLDAGTPADLYLCDEHENGKNSFDLTLNDAAMKNEQAATAVTYYRTQADALARQNRIGPNFTNTQPYQPQVIWARLDNVGGCWGQDIKSFTLNIMPLPGIEPSFEVKDFTVDSNSITVIINNPEGYMYSLDGITFQDSPVFNNLKAGLHRVYIRSRNECRTVDREVVVLNYPKFFSPNQDTYNDLWHIPYLHYFPKSIISIFDRYGKLITGFTGMSAGWDGTYNGNRLPATDYWFVLELEDGRIIKGHFSLIR